MKKRNLLFLLLLVFSVFVLASCVDEDENEELTPPDNQTPVHYHTYSDEWEIDGDYHWHKATCEHSSEISDKAAHDWEVEAQVDPEC